VVPLREGGHWKVLLLAGYAGICLLGLASVALGPFGVFMLPITMMCGMGFLGPIHDRASAEPMCPSCGRIFEVEPAGCTHQEAGRMVPHRHGQQEEALQA
jgi:hypothetical protein